MRPRFEQDLRAFSEVAKDELKLGGELGDIFKVIDWHLAKAAERQHTNPEVQREIYEVQKQKQDIIKNLKEDLACLDNPECHSEKEKDERIAEFNSEGKGFSYQDDLGRKQSATFGEIVTDMDWGIEYHLDKKSAPRAMIKKYLVRRAKNRLSKLLDAQIIKSEVAGDITIEQRKESYRAVEAGRKSGKDNSAPGFIAEKVVENFLQKLSLDQEFPFEIREADVFQDVEMKVDFIIHRKDRWRGVGVEADEKRQDIGIQFSTNFEARGLKSRQIEKAKRRLGEDRARIDDIVLVMAPRDRVIKMEKAWRSSGRKSGGPSKFISRDLAESLFNNLMKDMLTVKEIASYWDKVKNNFPERQ